MGLRQLSRTLRRSLSVSAQGTYRHDDADELAVVIEGSATIRCGDDSFELNRHIALWIPSGTPHQVTLHGSSLICPVGFFCVGEFEPAWATLAELRVTPRLRALVMQEVQGQISDLFARHRAEPFSESSPKWQILEMLPGLERDGLILRMPEHPEALRVAHALRENAADQRSLEEWAAAVFVSAKTVQRAFSAETGLTFSQWRTRCRMRIALTLLCQHQPVELVAHRVGYQSVSGFIMAFRREIGLDPGDLASSLDGPDEPSGWHGQAYVEPS
ncbi:AraC family transcriptional regulator [Nocardioides sp.]|uniref:helix-turn-helix transcriptional regulator n=1 Tax=Nocardioides sp. TaxID=35761 RepID=UPI0039E22E60